MAISGWTENAVCGVTSKATVRMTCDANESRSVRPGRLFEIERAERANSLGERGHGIREPLALGRRHPVEFQPLRLDAKPGQEALEQEDPLLGLVVAGDVVAVAGMAAADEHTVRAVLESLEDELRVDPARAHHADDTQVGRVLHARCPGQIRARIATPVAGKPDNGWIEAFHLHPHLLRHCSLLPALSSLAEQGVQLRVNLYTRVVP